MFPTNWDSCNVIFSRLGDLEKHMQLAYVADLFMKNYN